MKKRSQGFQSGLLSLTGQGAGRRALLVAIIFLASLIISSINLIGSLQQLPILATEIVLGGSFLVGFVIYDLLYQLIVRRYPAWGAVDRFVLLGSQAILIGLMVPIMFLGWLIDHPTSTAIALSAGMLWLALISGTLLLVRFAYGLLFAQKARRRKIRRS